jgi:anti-sigma factor RsiW
MDCDGRIRDSLPDFYLGQLPPDEAEEVRRHLAEHAACREALEEVAEVMDLMPYAAPATPLPAGLKERTLSRVLAEEPPAPANPSATPPESPPPAREGRRPPRFLAPLAAAAALLILSLVGLSYVSLERENDQLQAEVRQLQEEAGAGGDLAVLAVEGTGRAPDARGTAVIDASEGALALDVYNLPAPPEGHSYQAWLLEPGGGTVALGEMETNGRGDGRMTGTVDGSLASYDAVQVTLEPVGSEDLSGPVLMEATL